jgi:hypothetical protein
MKTSILLITLVILSILCLNSLYVSGQEEEEYNMADVQDEQLEYKGGGIVKAVGRGVKAVANNPTVRSVASKAASLVNIGTAASTIHDAASKQEFELDEVDEESAEYNVVPLIAAAAVGARLAAPHVARFAARNAPRLARHAIDAASSLASNKEIELDSAAEQDEQMEYKIGGAIKAVGRGVKAIANNPTVRKWAGRADKTATGINIAGAGAEVANGNEAEVDSVESADKPIHPRRSFHHRNHPRVSVKVNVNTQ